jgi:hypothetical protein
MSWSELAQNEAQFLILIFVVVFTKETLSVSSARKEHNSCDLVCVGYANQHRSRVGLHDTKLSGMFVVTIFSSKIDVKAVTLEVDFLNTYLCIIPKQVLKNKSRKDLRLMRSFQCFHLRNEVVGIYK